MAERHRQTDRRLGARYRLKRGRDISAVFTSGRRASDGVLVLRAMPRDTDRAVSRLAVAVSKRHGGAAQRNRIKRLCREAFRLIRHELPAGHDYVVAPHAGVKLTIEKIQTSLRNLASKVASDESKGRAHEGR